MTSPGSGPPPGSPWEKAPEPWSGGPAPLPAPADTPSVPSYDDGRGHGTPPSYGGPPGYDDRPAYGAQPGYGPQPGYGGPPPAYLPAGAPAGYGYPPGAYPPVGGAWGAPPVPPGVVVIPNGPVLRAASPGQRSLARLIDSAGYLLLLGGAFALGFSLLYRSIENSQQVDYSGGYPTTTSDGFPLGIVWFYVLPAVAVLIIIAYESLMIGLTGSTVGGRLIGVRFVKTSDGSDPGFGRALGRAAALGASTVVCYGIVFLLLLFSMFFDQQPGRYQSWMDKLCGLQAVTTKQ